MKTQSLIKSLLALGLIALVVFGFAYKKITPEKLVNNLVASNHLSNNINNKDYEKLNIDGVPVFVSKNLPAEEKAKINYALDNAKKTLGSKELKELKMIVYAPSNNLPEYLTKDENVSRNVNNNLTEGFYAPNLKEIYIFPDVIEKDSSFDQNDVMLFVTLHEIGHHIDLSILNHSSDNMAEKRASITAFNKINSIGINLDQQMVDTIETSR